MTAVIKDVQNLNLRLNNIEFCFDTLLKLNKNEDKFAKFAEKRVKEETERRSKELDKERAKEHKRDK